MHCTVYRFACEEPVGLRVVPLLSYPEEVPPCPISAEVDDPVSKDVMFLSRCGINEHVWVQGV